MSYIPCTGEDRKEMLAAAGVSSSEELTPCIPAGIRLQRLLDLPAPLSEMELRQELLVLSEQNADLDHHVSFLGGGAYDHFIPAVVGAVVSRSEFLTSYTQYQAEMSQGMLQAIYEYQSMICELTGMEAANASMYDGASASAEAALMACRITKRREIVVSSTVHPHYRQVLKTYLSGLDSPVVEVGREDGGTSLANLADAVSDATAAVIFQSPNFFGCIEEGEEIVAAARAKGALAVMIADPVSLGLLKSPGEMGVDIVVAEGQALGNSLAFGGPYLGIFAARQEHIRQMPGRVVGMTTDNAGKKGFCLTLQTREQHIRREKATSNICSNEALNALAATIYLACMGKEGLRTVAELSLRKAHYAREQICRIPEYSAVFGRPFFKEFVVKGPVSVDTLNRRMHDHNIIGGLDLECYYPEMKGHMLLCCTEKRSRGEIDRLVAVLSA